MIQLLTNYTIKCSQKQWLCIRIISITTWPWSDCCQTIPLNVHKHNDFIIIKSKSLHFLSKSFFFSVRCKSGNSIELVIQYGLLFAHLCNQVNLQSFFCFLLDHWNYNHLGTSKRSPDTCKFTEMQKRQREKILCICTLSTWT